MSNQNLVLSPEAVRVIESLRHAAGVYDFYDRVLSRLFNLILDQSDELGMSPTEAIDTLRSLKFLKDDLAILATTKSEKDMNKISTGNIPSEMYVED